MNPSIFYGFFVAMIMAVPTIYLFKLHKKLLIGGGGAKLVLNICALAAFAGLIILFLRPDIYSPVLVGALLFVPLFQVILFRLMWKSFLKTYHREPRPMIYNYDPGTTPDRMFTFAYFAVCYFSGIVLFAALSALGF